MNNDYGPLIEQELTHAEEVMAIAVHTQDMGKVESWVLERRKILDD
jgi:hypothetical protein|tara:strand:+ start:105 stop:242 length:138 start_codon:yes stop_codon:yes gene_type:complete